MLLPGKKVFNVLKDHNSIVMAANTRVQHSTRGIMQAAKEKNAVVIFEIAKSETGYTAQNPKEFVDSIKKTAKEIDFNLPYVIHADHITIKGKTPEEIKKSIQDAKKLIKAQLSAGFTSYAIDASYLFDPKAKTTLDQLQKNIEVTSKLAKLIPKEYGLEVEVGEIGKKDPRTGKQEVTTVDESVTFIKALQEREVYPDLLAINNGSIHGNIFDEKGRIVEQVGIDLIRTEQIVDALQPLGVRIAQHGITGTPLRLVYKLIDAGIRKGNVGTHWQNVVVENLPVILRNRMEEWTLNSKYVEKAREKNPNISRPELIGKNIKHSIKVFKKEIESIPQLYKDKITTATKKSAEEFLEAFRSVGTASLVK
jgi:fructose-bisphosphate aldolase class II